jgi:hypothetical protein
MAVDLKSRPFVNYTEHDNQITEIRLVCSGCRPV